MLGDDRKYAGAIIGPLDRIPVRPDAVVIYLSPAQALRLIIAFAHARGEAVNCTMTGQASLCSAIARAVGDGSVTLDVPCIGDRAYGMVQEHELVMAFPASRLEELVRGLRPPTRWPPILRPFTRWPAIMPPRSNRASPSWTIDASAWQQARHAIAHRHVRWRVPQPWPSHVWESLIIA